MNGMIKSRIADAGRVVIPAEVRRQYGLSEGDEVVICPGADGIEILSPAAALRRAQERVRSFIPGDDVDLTDELLAARVQDASLR
jgi:AbrB family transcriptional regulator (stage V sporulation protein T)